ncbi:MAG: hypothetical protein AAGI54_05675 [Planctomycetota bacterium]
MLRSRGRLKTYFLAACLTLGSGVLIAAAHAASRPDEPAWKMTIELATAAESPVGRQMVEHLTTLHPQLAEARANLTQAIGIDPVEDIQRLTLWSDSGDPGDVAATALLHRSVGNLEGWMLAMPGYESEELDEQTLLHSFLIEDDRPGAGHRGPSERSTDHPKPMRRVWVALPMGPDGNYRVAASFDDHVTRELAASLAADDAALGGALSDGVVAAADLARLPRPLLNAPADAPASAMIRAITRGSATIEADENMRVTMELDASSPVRARQIGQLMQGAAAMVQLAAIEDPNAAPLAEVLASLRVLDTEGTRVVAQLTATPEQLTELMDAPHHVRRGRPPRSDQQLDFAE